MICSSGLSVGGKHSQCVLQCSHILLICRKNDCEKRHRKLNHFLVILDADALYSPSASSWNIFCRSLGSLEHISHCPRGAQGKCNGQDVKEGDVGGEDELGNGVFAMVLARFALSIGGEYEAVDEEGNDDGDAEGGNAPGEPDVGGGHGGGGRYVSRVRLWVDARFETCVFSVWEVRAVAGRELLAAAGREGCGIGECVLAPER